MPCSVCSRLLPTSESLPSFGLRGSEGWNQLCLSAASCEECSLIEKLVRAGAPEGWLGVRKIQARRSGSLSVLSLDVLYGPFDHANPSAEKPRYSGCCLFAYTTTRGGYLRTFVPQDPPWPWMPAACFFPPQRPSLAASIPVIQSWMAACRLQHDDCVPDQGENRLPKRLIHVGDGNNHPRLCITEGRTGRYLTLSHRWGSRGQQPLATTSTNISSHCAGIPPEVLPPTFRDAVEVTRALGFEYIWIDSLCIIQDSVDDWVAESANMADIYKLSSLTLAADFGEDSSSGLFPRDPWHMPKPNPQYAKPGRACYGSEAVSQLDTRGWVLQERLLSRRTVLFTNAELLWGCTGTRPLQCSCINWVPSVGVGYYFARLLAPGGTGESSFWHRIVTNFTRRQLTYPTDRLPALTGIAHTVPLPTTDYLAGLWRGMLYANLLWYNAVGRYSTGPEDYGPGTPTRRAEGGKSWRIPDDYAPSWSWACVSAPVRFRTTIDNRRQDQPWRVIDAQCTPKTSNPYGVVSGGFVDVEGYIFPITIEELALQGVEQTPEGNTKASRELRVALADREDSVGPNEVWMDAGLAAREWADENYGYFLFNVAGDCNTKEFRLGQPQRTVPLGMVLRRIKSVTRDCFSRIGMVQLDNWEGQDMTEGRERRRFCIV